MSSGRTAFRSPVLNELTGGPIRADCHSVFNNGLAACAPRPFSLFTIALCGPPGGDPAYLDRTAVRPLWWVWETTITFRGVVSHFALSLWVRRWLGSPSSLSALCGTHLVAVLSRGGSDCRLFFFCTGVPNAWLPQGGSRSAPRWREAHVDDDSRTVKTRGSSRAPNQERALVQVPFRTSSDPTVGPRSYAAHCWWYVLCCFSCRWWLLVARNSRKVRCQSLSARHFVLHCSEPPHFQSA